MDKVIQYHENVKVLRTRVQFSFQFKLNFFAFMTQCATRSIYFTVGSGNGTWVVKSPRTEPTSIHIYVIREFFVKTFLKDPSTDKDTIGNQTFTELYDYCSVCFTGVRRPK